MRRLFHMLLSFAVSLIVLGCTPIAAPSGSAAPASEVSVGTITLNVFAAASLTDAFSEIGENFAVAHPDTEIVFNFAGSNQLATQISEGAPADVFASANKHTDERGDRDLDAL